MLDDRFTVLKSIAGAIERHGVEVTVRAETICLGREQRDEYSKKLLTMISAAPSFVHGEKCFVIFASEQYDAEGCLAKYAVKVGDENGRELKAWDLDTKRGKHVHRYDRGDKDPRHIPFVGSYDDIAAEIMQVVRMYDPGTGNLDE